MARKQPKPELSERTRARIGQKIDAKLCNEIEHMERETRDLALEFAELLVSTANTPERKARAMGLRAQLVQNAAAAQRKR